MSGGPTRRGMLAASLASLALGLRSRPARAAGADQLLVYWISGGWDATYALDPHQDSAVIATDPDATVAEAGGLPFVDAGTRPAVRSFFERWGSRSVIFNGISVGSISHDACTRLMLTGRRSGADADVCTRVAVGSGNSLVLPHVVLGGPRFAGAFGDRVSLVSPTFVNLAAGRTPVQRDDDAEARIAAWLEAELAASESTAARTTFLEGLARLPELAQFARNFEAVDLDTEAGRREVAVHLFSAGASRTVLMGTSVARLGQWDSHQQNHVNQDRCFEHSFGELTALMDALEATEGPDGQPLSERTRVLVLSEMGRQPMLNTQTGKDHWPITSALLIGSGLEGGRVIGATDDSLGPKAVDLASGELDDGGEVLRPGHIIATMAAGFDLDPGEWADGETPIGGIWA